MPREERDREDLLAETTALVRRAQFAIPSFAEPVFVGFHANGSPSFYFGPDRVFHFTRAGHLRRATVEGLLYKAQSERLVSLRRERTTDAVQLVSHELSVEESERFLVQLQHLLETLAKALGRGDFTLKGEVPTGANVAREVHDWLLNRSPAIAVAQRPNLE